MTDGSTPGPDPWRTDGRGPGGDQQVPHTTAYPVPGPFPTTASNDTGYLDLGPNAPAWARQAHAQGSHRTAPPSSDHRAAPPYGSPPQFGPPPYGEAPPAWGQVPPAYGQAPPHPPQPYPQQQLYPLQARPGDGRTPDGFVRPVFPPTAQQQPYQQPGYLPPGYRPALGGYPVGPSYSTAPARPGVVTGAAVLAFVQGGLLVIAGIITLSGAAALADLDVPVGRTFSGLITVLGVLTLVAAGLLIAGGVTVQQRRPRLLVAGATVSLLLSVWWAAQFQTVGAALTLAVLPIISLSLVLGVTARRWTGGGDAPG